MRVDTVTFAVKGAQFEPNDTWHCHCGAAHKFGGYAAAHWCETLTHTCECGTVRDFYAGRVKKETRP
jgi:hypothetical protein